MKRRTISVILCVVLLLLVTSSSMGWPPGCQPPSSETLIDQPADSLQCDDVDQEDPWDRNTDSGPGDEFEGLDDVITVIYLGFGFLYVF